MKDKLNHEQFVIRAIANCKNANKKTGKAYKGIHTVFSGFNDAFRSYYGTDPVEATKALAKAGKIVIMPVKRGAMLYMPADAPQRDTEADRAKKAQAVLAKILA